ncbi:sensor histidine kinase [Ornithinimicrobium ciconiae]|uniref:Sensor histidine kinase n=1 Tax=Ornithinimicrobium ciconiae TaxID=2594265 RepID=A0A516GEY9_9MICO|nr:sensor histidine kinase [Ornithinimicrobium ciconiae]QDO90089.1 sensor histidine kinase [Ornithinimicrobium ciconiae]
MGRHALFALLLAIGTVRAVGSGADLRWLVPLVLITAGWYVAGTAWRATFVTAGAGPWWLVVLTLLWGGLVLVSPDFSWAAFVLWMLAVHLMAFPLAVAYSVLVLAVVVLVQLDLGTHPAGAVLGPAIGALVALGVSRGEQLLAREAVERQHLVDRLVATQEEMVVLHDDLTRTQRESGALAERTRLSRDIHDTLAQGFSSILLLARAGAQRDDLAQLHTLLKQIEETAGENLEESRRVVNALTPAALEGSGLSAALSRLVGSLSQETGIEAHFTADGPVAPLATAQEVALLRVAQSALANVRQHSGATRVMVTLTTAPEQVRLDVADDGQGFDVTDWEEAAPLPAARGGYGLRSMRERLRDLGGDLVLESAAGDGTVLGAHLPLAADVAAHDRGGRP